MNIGLVVFLLISISFGSKRARLEDSGDSSGSPMLRLVDSNSSAAVPKRKMVSMSMPAEEFDIRCAISENAEYAKYFSIINDYQKVDDSTYTVHMDAYKAVDVIELAYQGGIAESGRIAMRMFEIVSILHLYNVQIRNYRPESFAVNSESELIFVDFSRATFKNADHSNNYTTNFGSSAYSASRWQVSAALVIIEVLLGARHFDSPFFKDFIRHHQVARSTFIAVLLSKALIVQKNLQNHDIIFRAGYILSTELDGSDLSGLKLDDMDYDTALDTYLELGNIFQNSVLTFHANFFQLDGLRLVEELSLQGELSSLLLNIVHVPPVCHTVLKEAPFSICSIPAAVGNILTAKEPTLLGNVVSFMQAWSDKGYSIPTSSPHLLLSSRYGTLSLASMTNVGCSHNPQQVEVTTKSLNTDYDCPILHLHALYDCFVSDPEIISPDIYSMRILNLVSKEFERMMFGPGLKMSNRSFINSARFVIGLGRVFLFPDHPISYLAFPLSTEASRKVEDALKSFIPELSKAGRAYSEHIMFEANRDNMVECNNAVYILDMPYTMPGGQITGKAFVRSPVPALEQKSLEMIALFLRCNASSNHSNYSNTQ